jgi:hypothetical protein
MRHVRAHRRNLGCVRCQRPYRRGGIGGQRRRPGRADRADDRAHRVGAQGARQPPRPPGNPYPHDGVGADQDSLGISQQRPSWGTAAQRMEPVASTNLFLDRLLSLPNWQAIPPWQAALSVQASAFTSGSNYRTHMDQANSILNAVKADSAVLDCGGSGIGQTPPGPVGQYGLPVGYAIPPGTSPAAVAAVTFALGERGKPYVLGANGPAAYDCSSRRSRLTRCPDRRPSCRPAHHHALRPRPQESRPPPQLRPRRLHGLRDLTIVPMSARSSWAPASAQRSHVLRS